MGRKFCTICRAKRDSDYAETCQACGQPYEALKELRPTRKALAIEASQLKKEAGACEVICVLFRNTTGNEALITSHAEMHDKVKEVVRAGTYVDHVIYSFPYKSGGGAAKRAEKAAQECLGLLKAGQEDKAEAFQKAYAS